MGVSAFLSLFFFGRARIKAAILRAKECLNSRAKLESGYVEKMAIKAKFMCRFGQGITTGADKIYF